jgi:hypothetical protein
MRMKLRHDPEADAVSIDLRRDLPFHTCRMLDDARILDLAPDDTPIAIELLYVSHGVDVRGLPEEAAVTALLREHGISIAATSAEVT